MRGVTRRALLKRTIRQFCQKLDLSPFLRPKFTFGERIAATVTLETIVVSSAIDVSQGFYASSRVTDHRSIGRRAPTIFGLVIIWQFLSHLSSEYLPDFPKNYLFSLTAKASFNRTKRSSNYTIDLRPTFEGFEHGQIYRSYLPPLPRILLRNHQPSIARQPRASD